MEQFLFQDLLIILSVSVIVLLIGHRLKLPPVVGFILTGVLAGPYGLGLISDTHDVETLAEIGIILLLFGIGMEFSIKKLVQIKRLFLLGGSLQVGLTILFTGLIAFGLKKTWNEALFLGCLISMSSTAIVLGYLNQKGEGSSPHGKLAVSILIFQDLIAIPMILMTPLLGSGTDAVQSSDPALLWTLAKGLVILVLVFISAQHLIPRLLLLVARTRNKELFLLCVLVLCFSVAYLTSTLGLSLTIGAFLAGLIISESEYSNEAISNIFPFQALFISFFFVSVGMLLNIDFFFHQPFTIIGLSLAILVLKIGTGSLATIFLGFPIRTAVIVGILLSQIGEFSFVLAQTGIAYGLGSPYQYQLFLSVALVTLILSPLLINLSPRIAAFIARFPFPGVIQNGMRGNPHTEESALNQHVIIVGFGISGRNLARSCKISGIPYLILEMNPDTVLEQKVNGEPIHFGDATHLSVLEHMHLHEAKTVAVLINDPLAARRIVKLARDSNPSLYIIVRTRFVQEMSLMLKLGADEVIPDEFGTSIEVFSRVLRQYHVPDQEINSFITEVRADGYDMLRNPHEASTKLSDIKFNLSNVEIGSFRVKEGSILAGKALSDSHLRNTYGMTVILIRREGELLTQLSPDMQLLENDVVVVVGEKVSLKKGEEIFGNFQPAMI